MQFRRTIRIAFVVLLVGNFARSEISISRFTIDGGGAMRSTGGAIEVSGTIGQADTGVLVGGPITVYGGFWFETPQGDVNEDGITGLADLPPFLECASGPAGPEPTTDCLFFDTNRSGKIDLRDYGSIQIAFGSS